jgi:hypothetical protein
MMESFDEQKANNGLALDRSMCLDKSFSELGWLMTALRVRSLKGMVVILDG